jgi:hypothetical protein
MEAVKGVESRLSWTHQLVTDARFQVLLSRTTRERQSGSVADFTAAAASSVRRMDGILYWCSWKVLQIGI